VTFASFQTQEASAMADEQNNEPGHQNQNNPAPDGQDQSKAAKAQPEPGQGDQQAVKAAASSKKLGNH
jgi:hypothetical protein